ncbi:hypothetical protein M0R45_016348 [Rubus argutus]|uniref:Transmembrane protein n=1 Tax=Rubus argutus TaxID=59490 RepID=A0AAW1XUP7_RUBAR
MMVLWFRGREVVNVGLIVKMVRKGRQRRWFVAVMGWDCVSMVCVVEGDARGLFVNGLWSWNAEEGLRMHGLVVVNWEVGEGFKIDWVKRENREVGLGKNGDGGCFGKECWNLRL